MHLSFCPYNSRSLFSRSPHPTPLCPPPHLCDYRCYHLSYEATAKDGSWSHLRPLFFPEMINFYYTMAEHEYNIW